MAGWTRWKLVAAGAVLGGCVAGLVRGGQPEQTPGGSPASAPSSGEESAGDAGAKPEGEAKLGVPSAATRRRLAEAYMRFDEVFMAAGLKDPQRSEVHKAFDAATMQFFSGNMAAVVQAVDALTARLGGGEAANAAAGKTTAMSDEEIAAWRGRLRELVASTPRTGEQDSAAWEIAKARADLVDKADPEADSGRFLSDQRGLAGEVEKEVAALVKGVNPYRERTGELWRPVVHKGTTVACRVYAPEAKAGAPRPLVIALHGAGGDEAMFLHAYGAGQLKRLADEQGLVVASPLTYPFMGNGELFDALVEQLSADYAIDRDRVYVLGHSMGGGAAVMLAAMRGESIAAAAGICGGTAIGLKSKSCPVLLVGGELDPIIRAASLKKMAERSKKAGHRVEYREQAGGGHTLTVDEVLPEVVAWLVEHRRGEAAPAGDK